MLAKVTSPTQLTLPASILQDMGCPGYFSISLDNGRIILTPTEPKNADEVRDYLNELGIDEQDVADAIQWARRR